MNGTPRDQISTDIDSGRPTLSPTADQLASKVVALSSTQETLDFWESLETSARRSPHHREWIASPYRYLADFDPDAVATIERDLDALLLARQERARKRGWEVSDS